LDLKVTLNAQDEEFYVIKFPNIRDKEKKNWQYWG
jgi:hypothetical protein